MKHDESLIQQSFVEWVNLQHPKLARFIIHVPNGGKMSPWKGAILKRMGVKAGVADILVMFKKDAYGGLWLEFKTKKGTQSESQEDFQELCGIAFYDYKVVRSLEEAQKAFSDYMRLPNGC